MLYGQINFFSSFSIDINALRAKINHDIRVFQQGLFETTYFIEPYRHIRNLACLMQSMIHKIVMLLSYNSDLKFQPDKTPLTFFSKI